MHFDDRLDTVLKQPVRGQEIARIQYIQLLDLLGKTSAETASSRLDPAYKRLSALAEQLPANERAHLLRDSGLTLRSPALVMFLAEDEAPLANAAVAAAQLDEQQWLDLVPALPVRSRGVLRHRRDLGQAVEMRLSRLGVADRGLPPAQVTDAGTVELVLAPEAGTPTREIADRRTGQADRALSQVPSRPLARPGERCTAPAARRSRTCAAAALSPLRFRY